jgi:hypothetical protein
MWHDNLPRSHEGPYSKNLLCIYILFTSSLQLSTPLVRTFSYAKIKCLFYEIFDKIAHAIDASNVNYWFADICPGLF